MSASPLFHLLVYFAAMLIASELETLQPGDEDLERANLEVEKQALGVQVVQERSSRVARQVYGNPAALELAKKAYDLERQTLMMLQAYNNQASFQSAENGLDSEKLSRSKRQIATNTELESEKRSRQAKRWEKEALRWDIHTVYIHAAVYLYMCCQSPFCTRCCFSFDVFNILIQVGEADWRSKSRSVLKPDRLKAGEEGVQVGVAP